MKRYPSARSGAKLKFYRIWLRLNRRRMHRKVRKHLIAHSPEATDNKPWEWT